jgi:hypothetical protein
LEIKACRIGFQHPPEVIESFSSRISGLTRFIMESARKDNVVTIDPEIVVIDDEEDIDFEITGWSMFASFLSLMTFSTLFGGLKLHTLFIGAILQ